MQKNKNKNYGNLLTVQDLLKISYDNKYWYLSVGIEVEMPIAQLTGESLGIDVGIKDLAVCSNGMAFKNINKSKEVRKLKKSLKRKQRQCSRKYEKNKIGKEYVKTKNIAKLEKQIKLIHHRLSNIRLNYIHQVTTMIVKTKPSRVVMEDLNINRDYNASINLSRYKLAI